MGFRLMLWMSPAGRAPHGRSGMERGATSRLRGDREPRCTQLAIERAAHARGARLGRRRWGHVYVRSYLGSGSGWFRRARDAGRGAVQTRSGQVDVAYQVGPADVGDIDDIDAAYRVKYGRYSYVSSVLAPAAVAATLSVHPANAGGGR
jgi:hypothetical protein